MLTFDDFKEKIFPDDASKQALVAQLNAKGHKVNNFDNACLTLFSDTEDNDFQRIIASFLRARTIKHLREGTTVIAEAFRREYAYSYCPPEHPVAGSPDLSTAEKFLIYQAKPRVYATYLEASALAELLGVTFTCTITYEDNMTPLGCCVKFITSEPEAADIKLVEAGKQVLLIKTGSTYDIAYRDITYTKDNKKEYVYVREPFSSSSPTMLNKSEKDSGSYINIPDELAEVNAFLAAKGKKLTPCKVATSIYGHPGPEGAPVIHLYNRPDTHFFIKAGEFHSTIGDGNCLYNGFGQSLRQYFFLNPAPEATKDVASTMSAQVSELSDEHTDISSDSDLPSDTNQSEDTSEVFDTPHKTPNSYVSDWEVYRTQHEALQHYRQFAAVPVKELVNSARAQYIASRPKNDPSLQHDQDLALEIAREELIKKPIGKYSENDEQPNQSFDAMDRFTKEIENLRKQAKRFEKAQHNTAFNITLSLFSINYKTISTVALGLADTLDEKKQAFQEGNINYTTFKRDCFAIINQTSPILTKDETFANILRNLVSAVLGLGIPFIYNKVTTGQWLFHRPANIGKTLNRMNNIIDLQAPSENEPPKAIK